MGLVTPVPCPDGFVCPPGTKSLGDVSVPCPIGNYCRGGVKKTKCPAGSYQVLFVMSYTNCIQSKLQLRDPELRDTLPEKMKWPYVS